MEEEPRTFTITRRWRARWWKIPWYVLQRKPWKTETVYENVVMENFGIEVGENQVIVTYNMRVPRDISTVHISPKLHL